MKFALISTHGIHKARVKLDCNTGDCTSFINWLDIWSGFHFNYTELRKEDISYLKDFDVVMMSGHLNHISDIINIAKFLKDSNTVSMFYPEGSVQLYDNSIRGFHREYYDAWKACDIISMAEEDKASYYKSFVEPETLVRFIHVPISREMEAGSWFKNRRLKSPVSLVYGDNNPNHPLVAVAASKRCGLEVFAVECGEKETIEQIKEVTGHPKITATSKLSQNTFLHNLGRSIIHFYPTEWHGTAREVIACAAVGTPCIGSNQSHTQMRLFPELACNIYDVDRMAELGTRLLMDADYYQLIANRAFERVQFYNLANTKKRFTDAWEEAKEKKLAKQGLATA